MALLLDTHALIWWLIDADRLSRTARDVIADRDNDVYVSAASAWEITIKFTMGKLPQVAALAEDFRGHLRGQGFSELAINIDHAERAGRLPLHHRDPFDRMLIAQAQAEGMTLVSNEVLFDRYGVTRSW